MFVAIRVVFSDDVIVVIDDAGVVDIKLERVVSAIATDEILVVFVVVEIGSLFISGSLILLSKKTGVLKSVPIPAKLREIAR